MKCRVCRQPAVIDIRRHNANFCIDHLVRHCRQQVERAIDEFKMFGPDDRLLVAVSGGKDSLAAWDLLNDLGYEADGLYVGLGIGEYSDASLHHARTFAQQRELKLNEVDLVSEHGFGVREAATATGRVPCSACGLAKRHIFDAATVAGNYDAIVTGHNLDDEAAVLYGNTLRWNVDYLGRQRPVLPATNGFPRKVKPLVRMGEREMAAYCVVKGIDYLVDECPMAVGNSHIGYKEALNRLEAESPGTKAAFYFGFLKNAVDRFDTRIETDEMQRCSSCGAPSTNDVCAFCRLEHRVTSAATLASPQPVAISTPANETTNGSS